MFKYVLLLFLLAASALGENFSYLCTDETLDSSDDVLTASCDSGDGEGTHDTSSLDLNDCFAYASGKITYETDGGFGDSCDGCSLNWLPDAIYYSSTGLLRPWLNCTCDGAEASINLDTYVDNNYGSLVCDPAHW